eukprot:g25447.t1
MVPEHGDFNVAGPTCAGLEAVALAFKMAVTAGRLLWSVEKFVVGIGTGMLSFSCSDAIGPTQYFWQINGSGCCIASGMVGL